MWLSFFVTAVFTAVISVCTGRVPGAAGLIMRLIVTESS
jgi:hypothetical protein